MKILGYTLLAIAFGLFVNMAHAIECTQRTSSAGVAFQACNYDPGEFVFETVTDLQDFIARKGLLYIGMAITKTAPNNANLPIGAKGHAFADPKDGTFFLFGTREPDGPTELLFIILPEVDS